MRILGVDPGLNITGYACIEFQNVSDDPSIIEAGVLRLASRSPIPERLVQLYNDLTSLIEELTPQSMAVEKLFSHYRHARTGIQMAHARGVVLLAAKINSLEIYELAATEVKRAITGNGHAGKEQIQKAVMAQCHLPEPPNPPDVADAIAIALTAVRRIHIESHA